MIRAGCLIMARKRDEYLSLRRLYEPVSIKLIIIAESPPASGCYFYDPEGDVTEPLFAALMKQLNLSPDTKESGLRAFQRRGWVLADATYEPVNALNDSERDKAVVRDYPLLCSDLERLVSDHLTPLILIKANVCRVLEPKLVDDGFNVINRDHVIYFPGAGRQIEFHRQFGAVLKAAGI